MTNPEVKPHREKQAKRNAKPTMQEGEAVPKFEPWR